ncbi:MAG: hypothetical protein ACKOEX_02135, partial [Planctomycetia bacterium]
EKDDTSDDEKLHGAKAHDREWGEESLMHGTRLHEVAGESELKASLTLVNGGSNFACFGFRKARLEGEPSRLEATLACLAAAEACGGHGWPRRRIFRRTRSALLA